MPKKINYLPSNSTLIIGHAFGSHKKSIKRNNDVISPKIIDFYNKNKNNIKRIIFSGDVLKEPTLKRWQMFFKNFDNNLEIHIAPGNHDVGFKSKSLRNIFELVLSQNGIKYSYPYFFANNGNLFIIDDSNKDSFEFKKVNYFIKKFPNHNHVFIIRHHVLTKSLKWSANMKGPQDLLELKDIEESIINQKDKKITFIYGDGGGNKRLPRGDCSIMGNSIHLINGIGDYKNDLILVLSDKKLYFMNL